MPRAAARRGPTLSARGFRVEQRRSTIEAAVEMKDSTPTSMKVGHEALYRDYTYCAPTTDFGLAGDFDGSSYDTLLPFIRSVSDIRAFFF